MDKKETDIYYLILKRLGQLFNIAKLYAPDHPVTKEKSKGVFTLLNELIAKEQSLSFSEAGSVFLVNGVEIDVKDDRVMKTFVNTFHDFQIGTLRLEQGITLEDFNALIWALSQTEHLQGEKQIGEYLKEKGAEHIVPLLASYKLVREDEKVISKEKIINIEELPCELINKFSEDLNKGDVSNQLKKEDKIYRLLTHDPNFLSQYVFRTIKETDEDAYKEFERLLMFIGDYLIDEISNARIEKVNNMVMDELKKCLLSLGEQKNDAEDYKLEVQNTFTKIRVAMQLKGLISLYNKNKKGLETTMLKIKEILGTLPQNSQLYSKTKKELENIGTPRLDVTLFEENKIKSERRHFRRLEMALKVKYQILNAEGKGPQKDTISWDIGLGGICLEMEDVIPAQTKLAMNIYLPTQPTPLSIEGNVIWCKKEERGDHYIAGVEFSSPARAAACLQALLDNF